MAENFFKIIMDVAEKLMDPEQVSSRIHRPQGDIFLGSGYSGLLLLFANLQRNGLIKEDIAHHYVLKIKEWIEVQGLGNLSLFGGVAGVCFSLHQASCEGVRYQRMLQALDSFLIEKVNTYYLSSMKRALRTGENISSGLYDLIQGLCGLGRYLLEHLDKPHFYLLAQEITRVFVSFVQMSLQLKHYSVPRWYLPPDDLLNRRNTRDLNGNFNLGLAHGIPGVLSFLVSAFVRDIIVDEQKDAMIRVIDWIREKSYLENDLIRFPYSVSFEEEVSGKINPSHHCKDAWCYGVPGVSRTLFLAAKALGDLDLKLFSQKAFCGIFKRPRHSWQLPGPTLCHGIAGLLVVTQAMSHEMEGEDLLPHINNLQQILVSFYNPSFLFGFKDVEKGKDGTNTLLEVDKAGFIEGSAGVLLTLLTLHERRPSWQLPLMIYE